MTVVGDEVLVPVWRWRMRGIVTRIAEVAGCHAPNGSSVMAVHVQPHSWFLRLALCGRNFSYLGEDAINRIVLVRRM